MYNLPRFTGSDTPPPPIEILCACSFHLDGNGWFKEIGVFFEVIKKPYHKIDIHPLITVTGLCCDPLLHDSCCLTINVIHLPLKIIIITHSFIIAAAMDGISFFLSQSRRKLVNVLDDASLSIFNLLVVFLIITDVLGLQHWWFISFIMLSISYVLMWVLRFFCLASVVL